MKIEYPFTRIGGLLLGTGIIFGLMWMYTHVKEIPGAYLWVTFHLFIFLAYCSAILRFAPKRMEEAREHPHRYGFLSLREGWANLSVAIGGVLTLFAVLVVGAFFPRLLM
jgi:hypothetical protein